MIIRFQLPAIAIDDNGNEQRIEAEIMVRPRVLVSHKIVTGSFSIEGETCADTMEVNFSFRQRGKFKAIKSRKRLTKKQHALQVYS